MLDIAAAAAPIKAEKVSRLVLDAHGELTFAPTFRRGSLLGTFAPKDRAWCLRLAGHEAPMASCTCGFYAVRDLTELSRFAPVPLSAVVLDVELGGRVIEHEFGVRASAQRVVALRLPDRCGRCGTTSPSAFRVTRALSRLERQVVAVCSLCQRGVSAKHTLSLQDVSRRLNIPIEAYETAPLAALRPTPLSTRSLIAAALVTSVLLTTLFAALGAPLLTTGVLVLLGCLYLAQLAASLPLWWRTRIAAFAREARQVLRSAMSWRRYTTPPAPSDSQAETRIKHRRRSQWPRSANHNAK